MATILIIEDRPVDRKLMATILRSGQHEVVEATDGVDALRALTQSHPDLVISDICMPTIDGYEFVRRMRQNSRCASTPVMFYTATYHEREARTLARQCGVVDILMKPTDPDAILARVDAALAAPPAAAAAPMNRATFDREHLQVVSATLARIDRYQVENMRMTDLVDLSRGIVAERESDALLNKVCRNARDVTLAQHAVVGLLTEQGNPQDRMYTSGFDDATAITMKPPSPGSPVIRIVVGERRPLRTRNPDGRPETLGLPADHPLVSSFLSVPIASDTRVYGWLSLRNKLGAVEFSDADEQAATTIGTYAGIAYENACLFDHLHRRLTTVEDDLRRLSASTRSFKVKERKRLSRTLHDDVGQALVGLKMDLYSLGTRLASVAGDASHTVGSLLQRLDETIASVRRISSELRPRILDDDRELIAAIESHAEEFERRSGIVVRTAVQMPDLHLDRGRSESIFRIIREALTNVRQHAQATTVTVSLTGSTDFLTISIGDDGRGITSAQIASADSLGLIGMRERAELLGGQIAIHGQRSAGTNVIVTIPLAERRSKPRTSS